MLFIHKLICRIYLPVSLEFESFAQEGWRVYGIMIFKCLLRLDLYVSLNCYSYADLSIPDTLIRSMARVDAVLQAVNLTFASLQSYFSIQDLMIRLKSWLHATEYVDGRMRPITMPVPKSSSIRDSRRGLRLHLALFCLEIIL
jgi:hypothetical protein